MYFERRKGSVCWSTVQIKEQECVCSILSQECYPASFSHYKMVVMLHCLDFFYCILEILAARTRMNTKSKSI